MALAFISIIDKEERHNVAEGRNRQVSLSINDKGRVRLLGGLSHGVELGIDKQNAEKLIELLKTVK
jgi:hypothetical protein